VIAVYGAAALAAACFALAFRWLGIAPLARRAIAISVDAGRVVRDRALDDDAKERAVRNASLTLLGHFASLTLRSIGALALSYLPVLAVDAAGVTTVSAVNGVFLSWTGVALACVAFGAVYLLGTGR